MNKFEELKVYVGKEVEVEFYSKMTEEERKRKGLLPSKIVSKGVLTLEDGRYCLDGEKLNLEEVKGVQEVGSKVSFDD